MKLFVLPSFDHDCTFRGTRFDDVSVIAPECAPCLESEDGGPLCEGHCFVGGGTVEEPNEFRLRDASRVTANFPFWPPNSALYDLRMFDDDQAGWASDIVSTGDVVKDTMRKEQIIKYV